jgi:hypothetical protein
MIVFALLGVGIWEYNISKLREKQQNEVSNVIRNIVHTQVKKSLLLPKIVFINIDSSKGRELNKKISERISQVLTRQYLNDDTLQFKEIDIKPFFVLPNKSDKNGNYLLTESQLNDLKEHLDFLTRQIDAQVDKMKEEVNHDIDRLNTWVTIWIGIIGFLGIFIPIVINIDTSRSAERATEKSDTAFKKADEACEKLETARKEIDKIPAIEQRIGEATTKLAAITSQSEVANTKSIEANSKANEAETKAANALNRTEKQENILSAVHALSNLKNIDSSTLQFTTDPMGVLIVTLNSVHSSLTNCSTQFNHPIVIDCLKQLGFRLRLLTFFKFINHANTALINSYSDLVTNSLSNNYDQNSFENLITELSTLKNGLANP